MGSKLSRSRSMSSLEDNGKRRRSEMLPAMGSDIMSDDIINKLEFILKDSSTLTEENPNENIFNDSDIENEKQQLKSGGFIKIAFLGRNYNNCKFCQTYFLNENSFEKVDVFRLNESENKNEEEIEHINNNTDDSYSENNFIYESCQPVVHTNSFPFFSNLNNLDFLSTYFTEFHKVPTFKKNFEFKTDFLSANYENCIELDLAEMSIIIEQLCLNDIVIYCTDKTNENILKEAHFFEYLFKRSNLFKNCVLNNQFFIVLNNHIHDSSLYHYQNEEANKIFKKLNLNFGVKFIYDLDIEKSYEEKVIYFSLLFNKIIEKKLKGKIEDKNKEKSSPDNIYCCSQFFDKIYDNQNLNKLVSTFFPKFETSLKSKLDFLQTKFKEVIKMQFRILNAKNFSIDSSDNMSKKFGEFYQNFLKHENYFSYELNRIKEFDKDFYDSIITKIETKVSNLKHKILIKNYLNKINEHNEHFVTSAINNNLNLLTDKKKLIKNKINESFDYIKKEIEKDITSFINKYNNLIEKIEKISSLTKEGRNFNGEVITSRSKLNFLWEIFDMYGLKHYYTSMSIEAKNIYYKLVKELYLNITKKLNFVHITFESLEKDIFCSYYDLMIDLETQNEIKFPHIKFENVIKLDGNKFFNLLLSKIFRINTISFKPFFAFYNISNLIGVIISVIFFVKGIQKYFKFQPNLKKIFNNLLYSFISIGVSYIFSCLLNKIYNQKSEKKFYKLINIIKMNVNFINAHLINLNPSIENYRQKYMEKSLNILQFLLNNK